MGQCRFPVTFNQRFLHPHRTHAPSQSLQDVFPTHANTLTAQRGSYIRRQTDIPGSVQKVVHLMTVCLTADFEQTHAHRHVFAGEGVPKVRRSQRSGAGKEWCRRAVAGLSLAVDQGVGLQKDIAVHWSTAHAGRGWRLQNTRFCRSASGQFQQPFQ